MRSGRPRRWFTAQANPKRVDSPLRARPPSPFDHPLFRRRPPKKFDAVQYIASYSDMITAFGLDTVVATSDYNTVSILAGRVESFDCCAPCASHLSPSTCRTSPMAPAAS